ncbi:hypothetical protein BN2476_1230005 [Paraburkholderia piptadeniae]|uniref:Uncharacterized protein n=1 Tax=Paraburkholderia piptadeniae TaxID=1701573 RepID=A0A1N7SVV3_9BURK|nr:hypothetical protein BN2476_1230005 [Paraburkholderia piptadeniae]
MKKGRFFFTDCHCTKELVPTSLAALPQPSPIPPSLVARIARGALPIIFSRSSVKATIWPVLGIN